MVVMGLILWVFLLILLAFWPARVAHRKGYSFILFFLLSLPFFIVSLILAYALPDKTVATPAAS